MNSLMRKSSGLLVVFVVAVVVIVATSGLLSNARFDLTENKLYTLSDGTKNILANLDQPIELTLYFSNKGTTELPALRTYANRVTELLEEYASLSHGKVKLTVVDPQAFSEDEDLAVAAGLQGVPVGPRRDQVFFGLVGRSGTASANPTATADTDIDEPGRAPVDGIKEEVIPFFQLDKESFLEYELTKLVYNLSQPKSAVVGVLSGLDLNGGFDYMSRQRTPAWTVVQQMEDLFELRWLADDIEQIDADISLLLVVHPKNMPLQTKLAIDQFVLKGGNTIVFVDPVAESEQSGMGMPAGVDKSSDLPELFAAWGIEYSAAEIVGDYANSMVVSMGRGSNPVRHIGLLGLDAASMNKEDVVVAGLENINLASTGYLKHQDGAKTTFVSLLASSTESMPVKAEAYGVMQSPDELLSDFAATGESYTLAARVMGPANTAFPKGVEIEEAVEKSEGEDGAANDEPAEPVKKTRTILPQINSSDAINVIVVADTDMLTDRLWVQVQEFFGQRIAQPWADNAGFVVNMLDNFSGNADLISIRSRGRFSRPFDRVEQLRRQAEEKFQEQQDILEQRLADAERKLAELEQSRNADDKRLLTPEQEAELASFQNEKLVIRKELREVQHQLDQDIEALGRNLKLINIFLVPLLLTVLVLFLRAATGRRRSVVS
ncbi:MAG: Gldg family protein [Hahellaceae bacterium]|nr:Gldg family protein [Hahellaceae bacterium]MCP5212354.1 Gldg family protein [Hahellaceae bacterium]